jgi:hypothetical protein
MTTLDQRLMASLKFFNRLRPSLEARAPHLGASRRPPSPLVQDFDDHPQAIEPHGEPLTWPPSLETLLKDCAPLPEGSVVLGVCDDSLPFLIDLANPAPGALLVIGDSGAGKTRLLRSLLWSETRLNSAEQAHFSVIATDPGEWMSLAETDHCQEIFGIAGDPCGDLIQELAALAEIRQHGRYEGAAIILAIDNLADLLPTLNEESYRRLYWLARHGPRSRIWTLASLPGGQAEAVDARFLTAFRTRLVGSLADTTVAASLTGDPRLSSMAPVEPGQFLVPYGDDWLPLWICEPQSTVEKEEIE